VALAEALPGVIGGRRLVAVMGVLDDKDAAAMLSAILPLADAAVFTRTSNPRSLPAATLQALAAQVGGPPSECVADPRAAVERARELAGPDGAVIVTGSIYLIADLVRDQDAARASRL
jgi:dihydrofolate synthase/folylpolyglutamate synthase